MERTLRGGWSRALATALGVALVGLTLTVGACLVTGNTDLPRPSEYPVVRAIRPALYTQVPFLDDQECTSAGVTGAMYFEAAVWFQDTQTDNVYLQVFVNDVAAGALQMQLKHNGAVMRTLPRDLCVPKTLLDLDCNVVEVVVYTDFNNPPPASVPPDPEIAAVQWQVLGAASGDHASATKQDCQPFLSLDGGV